MINKPKQEQTRNVGAFFLPSTNVPRATPPIFPYFSWITLPKPANSQEGARFTSHFRPILPNFFFLQDTFSTEFRRAQNIVSTRIIQFRGLLRVICCDNNVCLRPHTHGHLQNMHVGGLLQHRIWCCADDNLRLPVKAMLQDIG